MPTIFHPLPTPFRTSGHLRSSTHESDAGNSWKSLPTYFSRSGENGRTCPFALKLPNQSGTFREVSSLRSIDHEFASPIYSIQVEHSAITGNRTNAHRTNNLSACAWTGCALAHPAVVHATQFRIDRFQLQLPQTAILASTESEHTAECEKNRSYKYIFDTSITPAKILLSLITFHHPLPESQME